VLLVVWIVLVVKEEHECFTFRSELVATFIIAETIAIRIHVTHLLLVCEYTVTFRLQHIKRKENYGAK
jgi:hypothetical protein